MGAQEEEGQARCAEVLQGRRQRQDQPSQTRVSRRGVWRRHLHGRPLRPPVLRQVWPHLCLQQARGELKFTLNANVVMLDYVIQIIVDMFHNSSNDINLTTWM